MSFISNHIDNLIAQGKNMQICLRGSAQPIGPGKLEVAASFGGGFNAGDTRPVPMLYRMLQPATMQTSQHGRPTALLLPMVFSADDVLMVIEEPLTAEGLPIEIPKIADAGAANGKPTIWTPGS
mgnify:FL=1